MTAKRKMTVYLAEVQHASLARYARRRGISVAGAIRDAVDRLLSAEVRRRPRFIGCISGPEGGTISEHVDDILKSYLRRRSPQ